MKGRGLILKGTRGVSDDLFIAESNGTQFCDETFLLIAAGISLGRLLLKDVKEIFVAGMDVIVKEGCACVLTVL